MLFVDSIIKLVKLGIASSYLKDEKRKLNLILLGNPEVGKSTILLNFNFNKLKGVFVFTDLTKSTLEKFLKEMNNPKETVRYIIVPDFTILKSHQKEVEKGIIGILNSGVEDGLREITLHYGSVPETKPFEKPIFFGVATSMTRKFLEDRRRTGYWYSVGFLSRFIPISFSYSKEQIKAIRRYIAESKDLLEKPEELRLKEKVVKCSGKYVLMLEPYVDKLASASYTYGFRYTKQFRLMLKANALLRGSTRVGLKDVKDVEKLLKWVNLDYNQVE